MATRATPTPPAAIMGLVARRLFALAGTVALLGAILSLAVPVLDLRSDACGPVGCALMQLIGKVAASGGIGLALGTVAVASLRAGRFSAAALAALVAGPALLWSVLIIDQWRDLQAGTDEVSQMVAAARDYAASQEGVPAADLRGVIVNGRGLWASVRVTAANGPIQFVLLRRDEGTWRPQAIGPTFTRDQLRSMGAPTDLLREEQ